MKNPDIQAKALAFVRAAAFTTGSAGAKPAINLQVGLINVSGCLHACYVFK
jgi:hypothetical protein